MCHFQDWKEQQMGEQGNLLQKFTQGSLEGAENMDSHNHSAARLSRTTQKPGMKSMEKSHSKTGMTKYGKIKKISTVWCWFEVQRGEKIQIKNGENCVDKKIGGNWEIRRKKSPNSYYAFQYLGSDLLCGHSEFLQGFENIKELSKHRIYQWSLKILLSIPVCHHFLWGTKYYWHNVFHALPQGIFRYKET